MKKLLQSINLVLIGGLISGFAAELQPPDTAAATARIIGEVQDGAPTEPEAPLPGFLVPQKDVLNTAVHEEEGRKIIVREIKPISMPVIPREAAANNLAEPTFQDRLAEALEKSADIEVIQLGGTIYHSKDTPPRTLVSYTQAGEEKPVTFWSSADFSLLTGFNSFIGADGKTRSLMMM